ncbi:hypothetical protein DVH24_039250 [Malus domestica]|uniref:Uncharacterized protein n=1 Tax=Malus domestica TaxID=3750 RepID=A0A498I283_MALDO|nr:hypothetical protein DVH24_039250 [Malus domestica]
MSSHLNKVLLGSKGSTINIKGKSTSTNKKGATTSINKIEGPNGPKRPTIFINFKLCFLAFGL